MTNVIVRKATKEDLKDVIEMIQELADFQKMPDGPKLKIEDLIRDGGFEETKNENPLFHCCVAELQTENNELSKSIDPMTRTIVGYSISYNSYSTQDGKSLFLEDLYVRDKYRRYGIGKKIFMNAVKTAKDTNCSRLNFHVLKWNPAKDFYTKLGAINLSQTEYLEYYRILSGPMENLLNKN